jgi:uncharacterized membrane protein
MMGLVEREGGSAVTPGLSADRNDVIAAVVTRSAGSMPALYLFLAVVGGWVALVTWGPFPHLDPYPYPFLLFLNNVVQLLLCLVILVGQRVLGMADNRRALQTYLNAEAILDEVAQLRGHLDRLDSTFMPWVRRSSVRPPPQASDWLPTVHDRLAAWLTERLGSMWSFYLALAIQTLWTGLAWMNGQQFDGDPFRLLNVLSTVAQLAMMLIIMVGQRVLGRAADRRARQTLLNAEVILAECRRMNRRLHAHGDMVASLGDQARTRVVESVASALHATYAQHMRELHPTAGPDQGDALWNCEWDDLPDGYKEANRAPARHLAKMLGAIGCNIVPVLEAPLAFDLDESEVQILAQKEHERWMLERFERGYVHGPVREGLHHPDLVPWAMLSDVARAKNVKVVRRIPDVLAEVGFQIVRAPEPQTDTDAA